MSTQALTLELSNLFAVPETEVVRKGMLALIEKEIRLAEAEIAQIRERYDAFSKEALYQAIQDGQVAGHPAWEDYIVWKNKEEHIARLQQAANKV
jgi:type 1 glutamine amidotransferase